MKTKKDWHVYILECKDGSLYTGVTTDLLRRTEEHLQGEGAKYTKAHKAVRRVFNEQHETRSSACKREVEIKKLPRRAKLALIAEFERAKG